MSKLYVYSIFKSIQGEVNPWQQGRLAVFIRLTGCNLRCSYCDSMYAVNPTETVKPIEIDELVDKLQSYEPYKYVTITGGEPLLQAEGVIELIEKLVKRGKKIVIETNGTIDIIDKIHNEHVSWIYDYKLPSSGETDSMITDWFHKLTNNDFVKFVIMNQEDLEFALNIVDEIKEANPEFENFAFSPVFNGKANELLMRELADSLISNSNLSTAIFNLQIHKIIWRGEDGEH